MGDGMKHGKRPTVAQRKYIQSSRLNPENWLVVKDTPEEFVIRHRLSDKEKRLPRRER